MEDPVNKHLSLVFGACNAAPSFFNANSICGSRFCSFTAIALQCCDIGGHMLCITLTIKLQPMPIEIRMRE